MPSDEDQVTGSDRDDARRGLERAAASRDGFVYFRMAGGRFDTGLGMPTAAAAELQRYSELLYEVARLEWLKEHPERRYVRGLRDAFDLRLIGIKEGSARPVLQLVTRPADRDDDQEDPGPLFVRARDIVNETIAAVAVDRRLPALFPRAALPQLQRVGKTLQPNESIAFAKPRSDAELYEPETDAVLTATVRATVALIDEVLAEPDWHVAEGVISEFDGSKGTFRLDLTAGGSLTCHLGAQERNVAETVKDVLAADGVTAPDVTVGGTAVFNSRGEVRSLHDVNQVTIVRTATEKALMARLSELGNLQPGWWGPSTRAPGGAALRHAEELVTRLALAKHHVAIGADGDGSIVLEWLLEWTACTAELLADGDMYLLAVFKETGAHQELEGPFDADIVIRFVETGMLA
ncbi:hypothetical protein GCM10009718_25800 [Isoptericola halotolerans]|uniref:Uncharacterized protein n=1 Tax=Isoptericola halotolerans TaxID=300560 RepID=A0ABX2A4R9_9MICO|nr:hypothetical protein [Isoptericola halotolerans]NOV97855.1 hypothetical protein [Isoptericola halotolerans]